jgi:two-component system, OmpR family, response regulator
VKLLVVEDDPQLARILVRNLEDRGHTAEVAETGAAAVERGRAGGFDVAILDWSLPDLEGIAVLRIWRAAGLRFPVLMLTARAETDDKVAGLRSGADDYLVKPFEFEELMARLEGLVRRAEPVGPLQVGPMVVDPRRRTVTVGERSQKLTDREAALLAELARQPGVPISRALLLESVWRGEPVNPNVVDVYVGYVRAKLAALGTTAVAIEAVRGVGFKLDVTT